MFRFYFYSLVLEKSNELFISLECSLQMPHIATTYAAVNTLITLGGQKSLASINRWSVYVLNASFFIILCSIIYLTELVFICVELIGLVL